MTINQLEWSCERYPLGGPDCYQAYARMYVGDRWFGGYALLSDNEIEWDIVARRLEYLQQEIAIDVGRYIIRGCQ